MTVAAADDLVQRHPREAGLGPPQPEPRLQEPQLEGEPAEGVHHNLQFDLFIMYFSVFCMREPSHLSEGIVLGGVDDGSMAGD